MQYTYPEIRDEFLIYLENVYLGDQGRPVRCSITPRGSAQEQMIKNKLDAAKVKYTIRPGGYAMVSDEDVDYIVFDLGQDEVIDTTMREMHADAARLRNLNNRMLKTARYMGAGANSGALANFEQGKSEVNQKEALEELKKMISSIKLAQYSGESEPSYRYFYLHDANVYNVKHAMELMKQLGISGIEEYFSETSGQSVLRLPIKGVDGRAQGIIDELNGAIAARAKQDALKQLKEKINGYTPYESDGLRYIYLTFPLNFMAKAQELLRVLGISAEQHNMRINRNAAKRPDFRSINSNGMDYFVSSLSGGIPVLGIIEPTAKDSAWNVLYELKNAVTAKAGAKRDMGGRPGI